MRCPEVNECWIAGHAASKRASKATVRQLGIRTHSSRPEDMDGIHPARDEPLGESGRQLIIHEKPHALGRTT
jgi:hypothetical protein